jgi:hypothetical protein
VLGELARKAVRVFIALLGLAGPFLKEAMTVYPNPRTKN